MARSTSPRSSHRSAIRPRSSTFAPASAVASGLGQGAVEELAAAGRSEAGTASARARKPAAARAGVAVGLDRGDRPRRGRPRTGRGPPRRGPPAGWPTTRSSIIVRTRSGSSRASAGTTFAADVAERPGAGLGEHRREQLAAQGPLLGPGHRRGQRLRASAIGGSPSRASRTSTGPGPGPTTAPPNRKPAASAKTSAGPA